MTKHIMPWEEIIENCPDMISKLRNFISDKYYHRLEPDSIGNLRVIFTDPSKDYIFNVRDLYDFFDENRRFLTLIFNPDRTFCTRMNCEFSEYKYTSREEAETELFTLSFYSLEDFLRFNKKVGGRAVCLGELEITQNPSTYSSQLPDS